MDYQGLNNITKKNRYLLFLMKETLSNISKIKYFTKLDITAVFHKIYITKGQKWIIVFYARYKLFKYLVILFTLTEAPVTFQRYIKWVLRDYLNEFYPVYIDDILIFTFDLLRDYRVKIRMVLGKLYEPRLILNINKYQFTRKWVKYLGFIIKAGLGLRIDPEKIKVIWE